MPNSEEPQEDSSEALTNLHGEVIKTIGEGPLTVWVVKFDTTLHFAEAEKKLGQDNHFTSVQRDYLFEAKAAPVNDPYYPSQWHMSALNVVPAWNLSQGGQNIIGIIDSGCNPNISDLSGKCYSGYDAVNRREGQSDVQGHGTMVATTAAAVTNNGRNTAAPARLSRIYPVRAGYSNGSVSGQAILEGILKCGNSGIKIINISANGNPPYTFANKSVNGTLHTYFRWFHDTKGGLIFNAAGNTPVKDNNPLVPYLIVVSAIDTSYSLASFSTYGNCVWFTAPGTSIYCSTRTGAVASVSGTSFSSPLVASVAALIWGANPALTNTQVESVLKNTCYKAGTASWTQWYGYGMPNSEAAMRAARGQ
jgi:subtilisin family serine protease